MTNPASRRATYDDLLKVPDNLIAEIVEGELHAAPRPAGRHERAAGTLYARLNNVFDEGDGEWWISIRMEVHLDHDVLVPDIAGWRRARVPEYASGPAWTIAPDWICEVVSPSTGRFDRMRKLPAYARHGVAYAWLVDPLQQTLEVFRAEAGRWALLVVHGGDETARIEPFDAIEFPLASLWLPGSRAA